MAKPPPTVSLPPPGINFQQFANYAINVATHDTYMITMYLLESPHTYDDAVSALYRLPSCEGRPDEVAQLLIGDPLLYLALAAQDPKYDQLVPWLYEVLGMVPDNLRGANCILLVIALNGHLSSPGVQRPLNLLSWLAQEGGLGCADARAIGAPDLAVRTGSKEAVQCLVEVYGLTRQDFCGQDSPLEYAAAEGYGDIVEYLRATFEETAQP